MEKNRNIVQKLLSYSVNFDFQNIIRVFNIMKAEKYTLKDIQKAYKQIVNFRDNPEPNKFPQSLEKLGRLLVWGDRQDTGFFEQIPFYEALDLLLQVFSKARSKDIVIAIIGFFNMLWTNISRKETVNCLLSHPCVLSLQNIKFVALDNEIAEYYINFLKGLSRKLDSNSMHMFFNKRYPSFPLLMQTTRFYNHPESLVRTTCRNIILTCIRQENARMKTFATGFPFCTYFIHESNFMKQYWHIIDNVIELEGQKQFQLHNLDTIIQDHEEILLFIDDFMKIDPQAISNRFIDAFSNQCMSPLLQALFSNNKVNFSIKTVLFVGSTLLNFINNSIFCDFIVYCFFGKYYTRPLSVKLITPTQKPISYSKQWKFKGFWDSHQNAVNDYCIRAYFPNQKKIVSDVYANEEEQTESSKKKYSNEVRSIFGMGTNFFEREAEKLQNIFAIPIISDPDSFKKRSTSDLFQEFLALMGEENIVMTDVEPNPVREKIFSFIKSKDDTLVILALNFILTAVTSKHISSKMLQFCCLSTAPKTFDFASVIDIETILKNCLQIFAVQPPPFRICTYVQSYKLIAKFSQLFGEEIQKIPGEIIVIAKKALKQSIERVEHYLYSGKDWEQYIDIFNKVSLENLDAELEKPKYKNITLYTLGFLQKSEAEYLKAQHHQIYQSIPHTHLQTVARDFWLYLITRNAYCKLTKTSHKFEVTSCDQHAEHKASKFQIGSPYTIEQGHEIHANFKYASADEYKQGSLIFLGGFFVIGVDGIVKHKHGYEECLMVMDRSDPRRVMAEMGKKVFLIQFQNAKQSYGLRKHFEQMKTLMFKYQLSMLVKQTEWMLQQADS